MDVGTDNALGVISDALLLSHCEFLVGTHTSVRLEHSWLLLALAS